MIQIGRVNTLDLLNNKELKRIKFLEIHSSSTMEPTAAPILRRTTCLLLITLNTFILPSSHTSKLSPFKLRAWMYPFLEQTERRDISLSSSCLISTSFSTFSSESHFHTNLRRRGQCLIIRLTVVSKNLPDSTKLLYSSRLLSL